MRMKMINNMNVMMNNVAVMVNMNVIVQFKIIVNNYRLVMFIDIKYKKNIIAIRL